MERLFAGRIRKMKECLLYDRECTNCGECLRCDLDPNKLCDNCGHCLDTDGKEYNEIKIDGVELSGDEYEKWLRESERDEEN